MRNELLELEWISEFSDRSIQRGLENLNKFIASEDTELRPNNTKGPMDPYRLVLKLLQNFGAGVSTLGRYYYKGTYFELEYFNTKIRKTTKDKIIKDYEYTMEHHTTDKEWLAKPENIEWLKGINDVVNLDILLDEDNIKDYQKAIGLIFESLCHLSDSRGRHARIPVEKLKENVLL